MSTEQSTLDDMLARVTLVQLTSDDAEKIHRPATTAVDHAMPACDPHQDGEFVITDPDSLTDAERCQSPRCFGGDDRC